MSENKRVQRRYDCRLDVEWADGGRAYQSCARNISLGGLYIESELRPAFGARIKLKFSLPNQREPVDVAGIVRWIEDTGFGVQFDGMRARDVWAISKLIETLTVAA